MKGLPITESSPFVSKRVRDAIAVQVSRPGKSAAPSSRRPMAKFLSGGVLVWYVAAQP